MTELDNWTAKLDQLTNQSVNLSACQLKALHLLLTMYAVNFYIFALFSKNVAKGPSKYYIIKEVGGQMMMFDDKVVGGGDLMLTRAKYQYQNLLEIYLSFQGYLWSV